MRKNLTLLIVKFAVISSLFLINSHLAHGQQQAIQLSFDPEYVFLANSTQKINLTISVNAVGLKREIDNITLILEFPGILRDKIIAEIRRNGTIIKGNIKEKPDTFEIFFILEENTKIDEVKILNYILNLTFRDIDCRVFSEFVTNNLTIRAYTRLLLNELDSGMVDLRIRVDPEEFWKACFAQFLTILARGRLEDDLLLDLSFSAYGASEHLPPVNFTILVKDSKIAECISQVRELTCRIEDGLAFLESKGLMPSRFNLTLKLPRKALEERQLEVWVNYSDLVRSVALAPKLYVRDKRFAQGVLYLTLVNEGAFPYNTSNYCVTPESAVRVLLEDAVIVNPGEEKQIRYSMTIVGGKTLTDQLRVTLNLGGFAYESILFIAELGKPEAKIFDNDRIMLTFKLLCNGSLRLEIPEESPLSIVVEGFKILSCTASGLNCEANDSAAFIYGTLDLPSNVTISLEVRDEGGPAHRRVEVALSDRLRSTGFVSTQRETRGRFDQFLLLVATISALVVLATIIILRRRVPEERPMTRREVEEEIYFDLG